MSCDGLLRLKAAFCCSLWMKACEANMSDFNKWLMHTFSESLLNKGIQPVTFADRSIIPQQEEENARTEMACRIWTDSEFVLFFLLYFVALWHSGNTPSGFHVSFLDRLAWGSFFSSLSLSLYGGSRFSNIFHAHRKITFAAHMIKHHIPLFNCCNIRKSWFNAWCSAA